MYDSKIEIENESLTLGTTLVGVRMAAAPTTLVWILIDCVMEHLC